MKITKNNFFYGILAFLLVVNILVFFDINQFYIRAVLSFVFLMIVPGYLIMLILKIRKVKFWESLVYTIGLSVAFIMFAGLIVNWTLPFLNITDKPLALIPILISFDIFLLAMGYLAYKRNTTLKTIQFHFPKLDTTNQIFFIIPIIFPVLSILGALILNNHGPNILTMIMLGGIAVYVFCVVLFRKKLNEDVIYPWALWLMGLSLLLSFSLRSWYISGWDNFLESYIFGITKNMSYWSFSNYLSSYNACLSLNIFPTSISFLLNLNGDFIFKIIFQLIFSLLPLIIFIFYKKYSSFSGFLCSLVFIVPIGFAFMTTLLRQEIAFLFFGLMILVLFCKDINKNTKCILFTIFGFSMIVSHYSTSYIAIAIFLGTYILTLIYRAYEHRKVKKGRLHSKDKTEFHLTGILIILLLIFGFLWYNQVTPISEDLVNTFHESFFNFNNFMNQDLKEGGGSFFDQLNPFYKNNDLSDTLNKYVSEMSDKYNQSESYSSDKVIYNVKFIKSPIIPAKIDHNLILKVVFLDRFLIILVKLFIILGFFVIILNKNISIEEKGLFLITISLLIIMVTLPILSINYNLGRFYQQILIILSFLVVQGVLLFSKASQKYIFISFSIFLVLLLLFSSGFIYQIIGGQNANLQLNNFGHTYDQTYSHTGELFSSLWFKNNYNNKIPVYADRYSERRLFSFALYTESRENVLPLSIERDSYVYLGYTNKIDFIALKRYQGRDLQYNYPTQFLNDNKNKIYANGGSEIFK
ncbi:MAG TPA: DUF2206 domain-containing protein [Candidatus Pacearchaeota archaeon]|nr:DUF2206 domain-containing protein [Candidatus Pacearchaeota archaeon]